MLPRDRVDALAVFALSGLDSQSHLLAESARHESANRMRLPAGEFHDLGQGSALRPLDHFQDLSRLAAAAHTLGLFFALGRTLALRGLLGRLGLRGRDV